MASMRHVVMLIVAALASGCAPSGTAQPAGAEPGVGARAAPALSAVATYSVIADLGAQVGGRRVQVNSLVPPGADPHTYEPTPDDLRRVAQAHVVFYNGFGLEIWFDKLIRGSGTKAQVVVASRGVEPILIDDPLSRYRGAPDPHAWMDVSNVIRFYVPTIRDALIALDPPGAEDYRRNADLYLAKLDSLDRLIRERSLGVPPARRKLVTTENALHYFAARYGFEVVGYVYTLAAEAEPPARRVAELVGKIRAAGVPALFVDTTLNPKLMERLSQETGVPIRGALYIDSLGRPGSGAETYYGMMRANTDTLVRGLGGRGQ